MAIDHFENIWNSFFEIWIKALSSYILLLFPVIWARSKQRTSGGVLFCEYVRRNSGEFHRLLSSSKETSPEAASQDGESSTELQIVQIGW